MADGDVIKLAGGHQEIGPPLGLKYASGTILAAKVLTLNSSPPILVPAVANTIIVPVFATLMLRIGTPYVAGSQRLILGTSGGIGFCGILGGSPFLQQATHDLLAVMTPPSTEFGAAEYTEGIDLTGQALVLFAESSDPTDGTGTIDYRVWYAEIAGTVV